MAAEEVARPLKAFDPSHVQHFQMLYFVTMGRMILSWRLAIVVAYMVAINLTLTGFDTVAFADQHAVRSAAEHVHLMHMQTDTDAKDMVHKPLCQLHCMPLIAVLPLPVDAIGLAGCSAIPSVCPDRMASSRPVPPAGPPPKFIVS